MMLRHILLAFLVLNLSCVTTGRKPSSVDSGIIQEDMKRALGAITSPSYDKNTCAVVLQELQQNLRNIDWNAYTNEDLKSHAIDTMNLSWQLRLEIHRKLADIEKDCTLMARDIFHLLRDSEDYLGDFAYSVQSLHPTDLDFQKQAVPIYDRKAYPPYFVRPDIDDSRFKFRSGDLMLARGVSFTSAIISQISDNRSHFSHVVFVDVNKKTNVPGTVESYVGSGTKLYDINYALKNENARLLVLRPKDALLGQKAAIFANNAADLKLPYDYSMNFTEYSALSCVELAIYSYDKGSRGAVRLPSYPAQLNLVNRDFLDKMGLKQGLLITPDDLETDPNFELILDWKDYRLVRDSRYKDAILSEMMRWMNDLKYNFHDTPKSVIVKHVIQPSRRTPLWPLMQKITGAPDIDKEIPKRTLGVMTVLNQVGDILLEKIRKEDETYILSHHRPMTNPQLRETLEKIRRSDLLSLELAFRP
jgi:hypothetical protein